VLYRAGSRRASTLATQPKIEVYTDGQCKLCSWTRARVEPLDRNHRLEWLDYNDPENLKRAAPHTHKEMAEQMHVRPADGHWYKGYFAWIELVRVLPRWKWLAPVMGIWPLTKLGPIFYHWLASRRYSLFGVPPPCDESGVCKLHK
jgi:predicted DCC family thiol-disulfide oxidoreductase YuxK